MAKKIIRPINGMDQDSAISRRDDKTIYEAKNLRINSEESNTLGEYSNIRGPYNAINVSDGTIVAMTKLGSKVVILINGDGSDDIISVIEENTIPKNGEGTLELDNSDYYWNSTPGNVYHKTYSGANLGFGDGEVSIKSYYESENVQKIYWTTQTTQYRSLNIIKSSFNDPSLFNPTDLDSSPSVDLSAPKITGLTSGNLSSGKVYYTYVLANDNGAESKFSEISLGTHLVTSSETASDDYSYKGDRFDVDTGKGVVVNIDNIPPSFSYAKVYAIHYLDDVSLPVIRLIYDNAAVESLTIVDLGSALSEITPEEFVTYSGLLVKNGLLEIKNNRMFLANYKEEFFDIDDYATGGYWDARSYRFKGVGASYPGCRLYDAQKSNPIFIDPASPDYDSVPVDWDCVNADNDIDDWNTDLKENYIYQSDEATIGSSGKNVSIEQKYHYEFTFQDFAFGNVKWHTVKTNSIDYTYQVSGLASYANPEMSRYRTFKPEEVYRLGIQFKNSKQQYSYVKWIGDFKIAFDNSDIIIYQSGSRVLMKQIKLEVDIQNIPIDPETGEAFEYRIMYVPITSSDESAFWGLFNSMYKDGGDSEFRITRVDQAHPTSVDNAKYLDFVGPDYCLGNRKSYTNFSLFKNCPIANINFHRGYYDQTIGYTFNKIYNYVDYSSTISGKIKSQFDIEYSSDIQGKVSLDSSDVFSRQTVCPRVNSPSDDDPGFANKGRSQIIYPETSISENLSTNSSIFGCCYVNNFNSRYGGLSYQSRQNSGYIALSEFTKVTVKSIYGDSYDCNFEYLRMIVENDDPYIADGTGQKKGNPEIIVFPTISRINLNLRSDDYFSRVYTKEESFLIHEFAGVYQDLAFGANEATNTLTQTEDLYLYNNTYSREQDLLKFYPSLGGKDAVTDFGSRIVASQQKILGENADSYLKLNASTYIDLDAQYGDIKKILTFKDRLYFFQEKAIGIVSVSEKSATSLQDGSSLVIGELGVLARYDYITKEYGISDVSHIGIADNYIYISDAVRKEFIRLNESGIDRLSLNRNINSKVKSLSLSNLSIIYNRRFGEVLFTYNSDGTKETLVFSELNNRFNAIYTMNMQIEGSVAIDLEENFDELFSVNSNYESKLYTLNDGDYNNFGGSFFPSEITLICGTENENVVLFNVLELIAKQTSTEFIDTIRIYNDNYDTGELDVTQAFSNKFGKYRTSSLRGYVVPGNKERILDNNIYITIKTKDNSTAQNKVNFRDFMISYTEYNYFG